MNTRFLVIKKKLTHRERRSIEEEKGIKKEARDLDNLFSERIFRISSSLAKAFLRERILVPNFCILKCFYSCSISCDKNDMINYVKRKKFYRRGSSSVAVLVFFLIFS